MAESAIRLNHEYIRIKSALFQLFFQQNPSISLPVYHRQALQAPLAGLIGWQDYAGIIPPILRRSGGDACRREESYCFHSTGPGEPGFSSKESLVIYSMKGDIDRLGVIGRDRWWLDDKARKAGGLIVCHQAGGEAPGRGSEDLPRFQRGSPGCCHQSGWSSRWKKRQSGPLRFGRTQ